MTKSSDFENITQHGEQNNPNLIDGGALASSDNRQNVDDATSNPIVVAQQALVDAHNRGEDPFAKRTEPVPLPDGLVGDPFAPNGFPGGALKPASDDFKRQFDAARAGTDPRCNNTKAMGHNATALSTSGTIDGQPVGNGYNCFDR